MDLRRILVIIYAFIIPILSPHNVLSFHFSFHVLFHLILHYWGNMEVSQNYPYTIPYKDPHNPPIIVEFWIPDAQAMHDVQAHVHAATPFGPIAGGLGCIAHES